MQTALTKEVCWKSPPPPPVLDQEIKLRVLETPSLQQWLRRSMRGARRGPASPPSWQAVLQAAHGRCSVPESVLSAWRTMPSIWVERIPSVIGCPVVDVSAPVAGLHWPCRGRLCPNRPCPSCLGSHAIRRALCSPCSPLEPAMGRMARAKKAWTSEALGVWRVKPRLCAPSTACPVKCQAE